MHNQYKIIVLGNSGSGKTSIINRYLSNKFDETISGGTIGVDYYSKNSEKSSIQIWDTAGQERFRSVTKIHYRGTNCAMIVYDTSSRLSNNKILESWIDELIEIVPKNLEIVIIGNKLDLSPHNTVNYTELSKKYPQLVGHFLVSAKTGKNVSELFKYVIDQLHRDNDVLIDIPIATPTRKVILNRPLMEYKPCC